MNELAQSESVVQTRTDPEMITEQQQKQQQNSWSLSIEKFRYYNIYPTRRLKERNAPTIK